MADLDRALQNLFSQHDSGRNREASTLIGQWARNSGVLDGTFRDSSGNFRTAASRRAGNQPELFRELAAQNQSGAASNLRDSQKQLEQFYDTLTDNLNTMSQAARNAGLDRKMERALEQMSTDLTRSMVTGSARFGKTWAADYQKRLQHMVTQQGNGANIADPRERARYMDNMRNLQAEMLSAQGFNVRTVHRVQDHQQARELYKNNTTHANQIRAAVRADWQRRNQPNSLGLTPGRWNPIANMQAQRSLRDAQRMEAPYREALRLRQQELRKGLSEDRRRSRSGQALPDDYEKRLAELSQVSNELGEMSENAKRLTRELSPLRGLSVDLSGLGKQVTHLGRSLLQSGVSRTLNATGSPWAPVIASGARTTMSVLGLMGQGAMAVGSLALNAGGQLLKGTTDVLTGGGGSRRGGGGGGIGGVLGGAAGALGVGGMVRGLWNRIRGGGRPPVPGPGGPTPPTPGPGPGPGPGGRPGMWARIRGGAGQVLGGAARLGGKALTRLGLVGTLGGEAAAYATGDDHQKNAAVERVKWAGAGAAGGAAIGGVLGGIFGLGAGAAPAAFVGANLGAAGGDLAANLKQWITGKVAGEPNSGKPQPGVIPAAAGAAAAGAAGAAAAGAAGGAAGPAAAAGAAGGAKEGLIGKAVSGILGALGLDNLKGAVKGLEDLKDSAQEMTEGVQTVMSQMQDNLANVYASATSKNFDKLGDDLAKTMNDAYDGLGSLGMPGKVAQMGIKTALYAGMSDMYMSALEKGGALYGQMYDSQKGISTRNLKLIGGNDSVERAAKMQNNTNMGKLGFSNAEAAGIFGLAQGISPDISKGFLYKSADLIARHSLASGSDPSQIAGMLESLRSGGLNEDNTLRTYQLSLGASKNGPKGNINMAAASQIAQFASSRALAGGPKAVEDTITGLTGLRQALSKTSGDMGELSKTGIAPAMEAFNAIQGLTQGATNDPVKYGFLRRAGASQEEITTGVLSPDTMKGAVDEALSSLHLGKGDLNAKGQLAGGKREMVFAALPSLGISGQQAEPFVALLESVLAGNKLDLRSGLFGGPAGSGGLKDANYQNHQSIIASQERDMGAAWGAHLPEINRLTIQMGEFGKRVIDVGTKFGVADYFIQGLTATMKNFIHVAGGSDAELQAVTKKVEAQAKAKEEAVKKEAETKEAAAKAEQAKKDAASAPKLGPPAPPTTASGKSTPNLLPTPLTPSVLPSSGVRPPLPPVTVKPPGETTPQAAAPPKTQAARSAAAQGAVAPDTLPSPEELAEGRARQRAAARAQARGARNEARGQEPGERNYGVEPSARVKITPTSNTTARGGSPYVLAPTGPTPPSATGEVDFNRYVRERGPNSAYQTGDYLLVRVEDRPNPFAHYGPEKK